MSPKADKSLYYAVWPTAWGPVAAAAGKTGIRRFVLPHYLPKDLEALLAWEHPQAQRDDRPFERLIQLSRDYFNGHGTDFAEIDCELPPQRQFSGRVYRACRQIGCGQTLSYGQLARQIGSEDAARAVATALSKNPIPLIVPCHRVTYSDGRPGGFSAPGGVQLKQRMLALERQRHP